MKLQYVSALALIAAAGGIASARPVVYSTNFDSNPPFTAGNVNGKDSWLAFGSAGTSTTSRAVVVNNAANAHSGSQYIESNMTAWTADTTSLTYRYGAAYRETALSAADVAANPIVHVSMAISLNSATGTRTDYALDVNLSKTTSLFLINQIGLINIGSGSQAGSYVYVGTANENNAEIFSGSTAGAYLNSWHVFDTYINYATGLVSMSVDGVSLDAALDAASYSRTFDNTGASGYFDQARIFSERDRPASGTSSGGALARYDDVLVETQAVPTPGSAALVGVGGLLIARRRRA